MKHENLFHNMITTQISRYLIGNQEVKRPG